MGFNYPMVTEPLRGHNLVFTTKFPGVSGTQSIDLKDERSLEQPRVFEPGIPESQIQCLNHQAIAPVCKTLSNAFDKSKKTHKPLKKENALQIQFVIEIRSLTQESFGLKPD